MIVKKLAIEDKSFPKKPMSSENKSIPKKPMSIENKSIPKGMVMPKGRLSCFASPLTV